MSSEYGTFNVRDKTGQVLDHHYDDEQPGKPLYLIIAGGVIALAALALMIFLGYRIWIQQTLPQASGLTLIAVLAPIYAGGVFLFSYGYELYNVAKALRLTVIIVFSTLAAGVIVVVLIIAFAGMGDRGSRSSRSPGAGASSGGGGVSRGSGPVAWPIFIGGFGSRGPIVTREVIHDAPSVPPSEQPIRCPFCGKIYVPAETQFACPTCGAETPTELIQPSAGEDSSTTPRTGEAQ